MRVIVVLLVCCIGLSVQFGRSEQVFADELSDSLQVTEKEGRVASSAQRWREGGVGGTPDYVRHIVPLFSKLGCNNRACHGSFQGQSGFRLSLFGFEPAEDLKELLEDEGDGPRANIKEPESSLILFKPTHADEHEGGQRMEVASWQHRMFRQWIADGASYDPETSVVVDRLEVIPSEIVAQVVNAKPIPLRAIAHFSDGTSEDVSGLTVFSSNDKSVVSVSEDGTVTVLRTGDTAVIARYSGSVTSTQVLVPRSDDKTPFPLALPHNKIDEFVVAKLRKLNVRPSVLSKDADFIRRVYLDVIGRLPSSDEARQFLTDRSPDKREKVIDVLLDDPAYARYWGMKFSDWTGNSKYINNQAMLSNWMWQQWTEDKLARNVPYDELVYGFVCATSLEGRPREDYVADVETILHRAAGRFHYDDDGIYARRRTNELYWGNVERRNPDTMVLQTANSFLGLRLECAQCHNHPFDRWTQKDFNQFKSVFMMVRYCEIKTGEEIRGTRGFGVESIEAGVSSRYATTVKQTPAKLLGGPLVSPSDETPDVRIEMWKWMRAKENPYFAPAFVNRLWHHYLGRGIVDPPDDFNQGNPPSNPQLLNWLAKELLDHDFDIKHIHRLILNSRTYQLSWEPNDSNRNDVKNFSRSQLRRMPAEVLIDAIADTTGVPNFFGAQPKGRPQRAVGQAMTAVRYGATRGGYPMKIFGRPDREKTCDCERSNEPAVAQALYLINDNEVLGKLADKNGRLTQLLKTTEDDKQLITELYLVALPRFPDPAELEIQRQHVVNASTRAEGMRDVLWSLLNVREFVFIH
jgi:hypothetical protein